MIRFLLGLILLPFALFGLYFSFCLIVYVLNALHKAGVL